MKKKVTSSKVPAAARSGFGRARPRTTDEAAPAKAEQVEEKPAQQIFRIAGVQMASGPSVSANLNEAKRLIGMAVDQGAGLVALPEWFACMGLKDTDKVRIREKEGDGPIQKFLADTARRNRIWLIGCSVPLESSDPGRVFNSLLVYDDTGKQVARYDKIHLFNFEKGEESFDESRTICPGSEVRTFEAPFGRVGLSVCYDLRFPELYRKLGDCALMVVPSAFTYTTGNAHWETLLKARAVENQCYVLAAAQGGRHENGRRTWGHSMLIDPWGEIVAVKDEGMGVVAGGIDLQRIAAVRQSLPAYRHRVIG